MKLWQSRFNSQRKLSQQSLLDISEEITQSYAPHDTHQTPELVLMPVDPINLYAYWNLKESETDNITNQVDKQLALRIYSLPELSERPGNIKLSFDIKVQGFHNQQKIHLPIAASAYSAVIGEINSDNSFSALATSDTVHVPRQSPVSDNEETTIQTDKTQEDICVTHHAQLKATDTDNNLNNHEIALAINQTLEPAFTPESNPEITWSEPSILKNYNDYGYDLKIYEQQSAPGPKATLFQSTQPKHSINAHINVKTSNSDIKNTSGKGRL